MSNECKGLIFRLHINFFKNSKGHIVYKETMVPLKRRSCPGCQYCGFLLDDLSEHDHMPIVEDPEHGALYMLGVTNESRDFETGIIDDWDLIFRRCLDD